MLLLQWKMARSGATAQRLYDTVQTNLHNPAREPLWGSPGSVLAAIAMAEHTGEPRWAALVKQAERDRALHGQGRHTLWTGDIGMACVMWDCITGRPVFPTLDVF